MRKQSRRPCAGVWRYRDCREVHYSAGHQKEDSHCAKQSQDRHQAFEDLCRALLILEYFHPAFYHQRSFSHDLREKNGVTFLKATPVETTLDYP